MAFQYSPYLGPVFVSAVLGLALAAFVLQYRDRPGAVPLAAFLVSASLWSFAEAMNLAHADLAGKVLWTRLEIVFSGLVPLTWLALVLEYTGSDRFLSRRSVSLLLVEPLAVVAVLVVRPRLFRPALGTASVDGYRVLTETFGPAMYVHLVYSYLLLLVGAALLVKVILFAEGLYRAQCTALLVAMFLPVVGNVLYVFGVLPSGIDPTNVAFLLTGFVVAGAIFHNRLLDVVPVAREVARDEVLESLDDRVFVLDDGDRLADCNPAALELVDGDEDDVVGEPIAQLLPAAAAVLDEGRTQTELTLEGEDGLRHFDVRVSPLHRAGGMVTGRLLSLRDVTEKRRQRQRLDVLNRLLRHNLRNELNVIAGSAELVGEQLDDERLRERVERIETTANRITERSDKVGRITDLLDGEVSATVDLVTVLEDIAATARETYPSATVDLAVPDRMSTAVGATTAVAIEELVANAIEHNDGDPTVTLSARTRGSTVVIEVADDGPGIAAHELTVLDEGEETALEHGSGVGLWMVNWTVEQVGGRLDFESTREGTTVTVTLPRSAGTGNHPASTAED